mmetsp:Transcript_73394/g.174967  ORF Transcript_73394/g.174967 Transcript_73394/m.174967 type:complete len:218 (+) Transcript_73394:505-1158(+)
MLVQGQQQTEVVRIADRQEQGIGGPVPAEDLVRDQLLRHPFSLQLLGSFAQGQGVRLRKEVGHELVVVGHRLTIQADGILGGLKADEVCRNHSALVHELVEGVLAIGARLPEVDRTCGHCAFLAVHLHALAVALHVQLLDMRHKAHQRLAVRQHGTALVAQAGGIPNCQQPQDRRQVLLQGRGLEVHVHGTGAAEELLHHLEAVLKGQRNDAHSTAD